MSAVSPTSYTIHTKLALPSKVDTTNAAALTTQMQGLARGIMAPLGALAAGFGLASAIKSMVSLNAELQTAELGIATLYNALGKMPMTDALKSARVDLRGLREDAAKGAGGFMDYVKGYQTLIAPITGGGGSLAQVRELNKMAIAAAAGMPGVGTLNRGAMDIQQAMTSGASQKTTPIVMAALNSMGMSGKEFKGLDQTKKVETLIKAFGAFKGSAEEYAKTWDARTELFKNNLQDIVRTVGKPLFDKWSNDLGRVNEWLEKNKHQIDEIAQSVGVKLVDAFDKLAKVLPTVMAGAAAMSAGGYAGKMVSGMGGIPIPTYERRDPSATWNGKAGRWQMPGGQFAGGGGMGMGTVGGMAGGSMGMIGGLATALVAAFVATVTGSVMVAIKAWPGIGVMLGKVFGDLGLALWDLAQAVGRFFNNPVIQFLGMGFAYMLGGMAKMATVIVKGFTLITDLLTLFIKSMVYQTLAAASEAVGMAAVKSGIPGLQVFAANQLGHAANLQAVANFTDVTATEMIGSFMKNGFAKGKDDVIAPGTDGKPVTQFNNNFNGPITIKVEAERLDDPNVVASTIKAAMQRVAEYPTQARRGNLAPKPL